MLFPLQATPFCVVALRRCYIILTQTQEEHGVPPNKHYEIPFVRGYAVLFPLQATQLRVVALWRCYIIFTQTQEEHGVLRTNIMKYRL